jgi:hypothetical protein
MAVNRLLHNGAGLFLSALLVAGCAVSTKLRTTWIAPDYEQIKLSKIAVFVISQNRERVRTTENILAAKLGPRAVPGHRLLRQGDEGNRDRVAERLRQAGIDGAVTLRLLAVEKKELAIQTAPSAPSPYVMPSFGDYYFTAMNEPVAADIYRYRQYAVETIAYSLIRNKAIWRGVAEANDPDSEAEAAENVGEVLAQVLQKAGFF